MMRRPCKYGCGNEVAHNAKACPKCGGRKPYPTTARDVAGAVLVIAVIIVAVVASSGSKSKEKERSPERAVPRSRDHTAPAGMGIVYAELRATLGEFLLADEEKPGGRFARARNGIAILDTEGPAEDITSASLVVGFPSDNAKLAQENREILRRFVGLVLADWPAADAWVLDTIRPLAGTAKEVTRVARGRTIVVSSLGAVTVTGPPLAPAVRAGRQIVERALASFPKLHPWYLTPHLSNPLYQPKAALHLPAKAWANLTDEERVSVRAYVASYVPDMKSSPFDFATGGREIARDAPVASMLRDAVAKMGPDDWEIATGSFSEDGRDIVPDEEVASGATKGGAGTAK